MDRLYLYKRRGNPFLFILELILIQIWSHLGQVETPALLVPCKSMSEYHRQDAKEVHKLDCHMTFVGSIATPSYEIKQPKTNLNQRTKTAG